MYWLYQVCHILNSCFANLYQQFPCLMCIKEFCWPRCAFKKVTSAVSSVARSLKSSQYMNEYRQFPFFYRIKEYCRPLYFFKNAYWLYQAYQTLFKINHVLVYIADLFVSSVSRNIAGYNVYVKKAYWLYQAYYINFKIQHISIRIVHSHVSSIPMNFSNFTIHQYVSAIFLSQAYQ